MDHPAEAAPQFTREDRRHASEGDERQRSNFERDRDALIYTTAFRRLAGVTQVVTPAEGQLFHNRLTHTLEVAQIGLRLAQYLQTAFTTEAETYGGLDPSVVEAAALAHDLGHPPFGHIAEITLNELITSLGAQFVDGYEGNAQSFRIITKLAVRRQSPAGLNLTRAVLDATLKYPWMQQRGDSGEQRHRKWGAYSTETEDFEFARVLHPAEDTSKSLEAELMDWSDDIAYAIHDTEDFFRAGLIPLDRLATNSTFVEQVLVAMFERWDREAYRPDYPRDELADAFRALCRTLPITEPYSGTHGQRAELRIFTSDFIGRYIHGTALNPKGADTVLKRDREHLMQVLMLKQLTWQFVIKSSALASQQHGQELAVRKLFEIFWDAATHKDRGRRSRLPLRGREAMERWEREKKSPMPEVETVRIVADAIAEMTDQQAMLMYHRFMGIAPGSAFDVVVL